MPAPLSRMPRRPVPDLLAAGRQTFSGDDGGGYYRRLVIPAQARLQGCTPAWMQVVEPRREQAAEVVGRRLELAAEESSGLFG